jgi:hypothetical protein
MHKTQQFTMYTGVVRRKIGKTILFCIFIIVFSVLSYEAVTRLFSIQVIEVVGNGIQVQVDEKKISKTLLFFPSDRLRGEVLRDNPLLADVYFRKRYPHTLVIIPTLRPAFARLQTNDRVVLLDRSGTVLMDGDQGKTLPLFRFHLQFIRVGEVISDTRVQLALSLLDRLGGVLPVDGITEQDGPYILVKTGKTDIFIPQDKELDDILATLQTLMTGFRIKGTLPEVVDLRFDKPVIKF